MINTIKNVFINIIVLSLLTLLSAELMTLLITKEFGGVVLGIYGIVLELPLLIGVSVYLEVQKERK